MSARDQLTTTTDQGSVLWTLEEIGRLVSHSGNPAETLNNLVHLIKRRFGTDVCSVYLLEPDRVNLVLAATIGLRPEGVGRVRMRLTEGLAGLVAEQLRPQVMADATAHPRFKYFHEAGEDPYRSFLGVPILDRGLLVGVLVVQTVERRTFSQDDVRMLVMAGTQLAPIVSEARTLGHSASPAHQRLYALARNLWWSWDNDTTTLFRELDPVRWREFDHNPIALLQQIPIEALEERAQQLQLHSRINYAYRRLQEYLKSEHTWGARYAGVLWARPVAYFSAEFGIHESVPIYSGGLGILAGDHIKSASDLGIPLVGVGLYYDQGYFKQRLDLDGRQHEDYLDVDSGLLPIQPATRNGEPITVSIATRTGTIAARVWSLSVGRNTLLLLDSNVDGNQPEDRELTARLYGGDDRVRIRQELLLGVGGVRALLAMGVSPGVVHLNEGHSAFAALELMRHRMDSEGIDAWEAIRRVSSQIVFTTHTPVPAGHDRFSTDLVEEHLGPLREALHLGYDDLMALGRVNTQDSGETFCMTVLALKLCRRANAVSSVHGQVSRAMWAGLYPGGSEQQVPIGHITNGVHVPSWLADQMRQVYNRHLGPDWPARSATPGFWEAIDGINDGELWETHQTLKTQLIETARRRAVQYATVEPGCPHDWLRAPLRHVQAGEPAPEGHRCPRGARQPPAASRAVHLRGQGAPARQRRQGHAAAGRAADAGFALRGQAVVPRGLRHQRRPAPGPGRGSLGQQPSPSAGGLWDKRTEGRAEWRLEPVDPRRLVGRGLRRSERLRDRRRRNPHVGRRSRST